MNFAVLQLFQLLHRQMGYRIIRRGNRQGDQDLIGMQARVMIAEMLDFQLLNRFDDIRGDQRDIVVDAADFLSRIQQCGAGGA